MSEVSNMSPSLVVRGSQGLCLQAPPDFAIHQGFSPDLSKNVKVFSWSRAGTSLAWSNMAGVTIATVSREGKWTVQHQLPQTKARTELKLSNCNPALLISGVFMWY